MRNEPARALRARRRAIARARMRRIASGIGRESDALVADALLQGSRRLAPAEHWRPPDASSADNAAQPAPMRATVLPPPATWLDRGLLAVEAVSVVGLVAVFVLSLGMLRGVQEDVRAMPAATETAIGASLAGPTETETAALVPATPQPTATAIAHQPTATLAPWPPTLAPTAMPAEPPSPAPTPDSPTGVRFVIPAIGIDAPMVEGDDWETLKEGIGHRIGSAWPGERGNVVVAAHNDVYGSIFRDLNRLRPGDLVLAQTASGVYRYQVESSRIVLPTEVSVIEAGEEPVLTMITCYPPFVDTHRIVVRARLVE